MAERREGFKGFNRPKLGGGSGGIRQRGSMKDRGSHLDSMGERGGEENAKSKA